MKRHNATEVNHFASQLRGFFQDSGGDETGLLLHVELYPGSLCPSTRKQRLVDLTIRLGLVYLLVVRPQPFCVYPGTCSNRNRSSELGVSK